MPRKRQRLTRRNLFSAAEQGFGRKPAGFRPFGPKDPREDGIDRPAWHPPVQSQDEELQRLIRLLDDEALAKRVQALAKKFPSATTPELVTMDWLDAQRIEYEFQSYKFGGRQAGKGVPDFALIVGPYWIIWAIQGEYWHGVAHETKEDQRAERRRLLGKMFVGRRVLHYVELWENDIFRRRPYIFQMGLQGIDLREI